MAINFFPPSARYWVVMCAFCSKYNRKHTPTKTTRALNVAWFLILIFTADQTRRRGRGPGRDAVCRADEKQTEYKSLRTRRELATAPAWALSRGIEMVKTENRKPEVKGKRERKPKTEKRHQRTKKATVCAVHRCSKNKTHARLSCPHSDVAFCAPLVPQNEEFLSDEPETDQ